jgi:hypothetical protein
MLAAAVVCVLLGSACTSDGPHGGRTSPAVPNSATRATPAAQSPPPSPRNIFYLLLDDYGGARALKDLLGFDNTPFRDALRSRGFYVPDHPTTNYPRTLLSLGSSLNLDYVQALLPRQPAGSTDLTPLNDLLQRTAVPQYLKARGYRYLHLGSWWAPTATDPEADQNISLTSTMEEAAASLHVPFPEPSAGENRGGFVFVRHQYFRTLYQFQQLTRLAAAPPSSGLTFVFAHILMPHRPFLLDAAGRFRDPLTSGVSEARSYTDQIQAVNRKILALIDELQAVPADQRPVIILQSDEGFFTGITEGTNVSDSDLEQHFGILAAYSFPGVTRTGLYPTITPVNVFRLLFDDYFDARLPLLPDRNYVYPDLGHEYTLTDVTDRVAALR